MYYTMGVVELETRRKIESKKRSNLLNNFAIFISVACIFFSSCKPITADTSENQIIQNNPIIVMAIGDIMCNPDNASAFDCQDKAVAKAIESQKPDIVTLVGDVCHEATIDCYEKDFDSTFGKFKNIIYPVLGNHDNKEYFFDYFDGIGKKFGSAGDRDKGYYFFDIGKGDNIWHILAINSECGISGGCRKGSQQYIQIEEDLKKNVDKKCSFAFWHKPLYASWPQATEEMRDIYELMYKYGVEFVINGHEHGALVFRAMDASGNFDKMDGVREFIIGTGGAGLILKQDNLPDLEAFDNDHFGAFKFTLKKNGYDWEFIPVGWFVKPVLGSDTCH